VSWFDYDILDTRSVLVVFHWLPTWLIF